MSTATLMTHSPKYSAKLTDKGALARLAEPVAMGTRHKPVPHHILIDTIGMEVEQRGWKVAREQYALSAKGEAIFGVMDLQPHQQALVVGEGRGVSLGFRSSTNQDLAIHGVAGSRVFVCDNLALSGQFIAFQRKSTTGLDLKQIVAAGFDKFIKHQATLELNITKMQDYRITTLQAKVIIFNLFDAGVVPARLFDDVSRNYFKPTADMTDVTSCYESLWALHNAVTRAIRDLTPVRGFNATAHLGRLFDQAIEGEVVR